MSRCLMTPEQCDGSGFLYDDATNTAYDCPCRPQLLARNRARSLSGSIPKLYRDKSFAQLEGSTINPRVLSDVKRFADRIDANLDAGRGLWLMGGTGTGKTTLAMLVSKAALAAGRTVGIYSLPDLLRVIRHTFEADAHQAMFEQLVSVDLLHIDDIGAEQTTPWVIEELYSIVNARYEEQRSMVITTNILDANELRSQITERTVSRLTEMCDEVLVEGEDHRMGFQSRAV